ncbi:hypothetical protein DFH09DRAFT_864691, partial [Mycena vulgaris]
YIQAGKIDKQTAMAGGGSCGIASTNFVETRAIPGTRRWHASDSAQHRDIFLQELLLYHLLA